ncbi:MAG TPA: 3-phosphoshikimate 1-carboxyvinyltransferase [Gammaproteobacteria bacterium]|nr:3-phosphoshikimate 1-carboxyvinyltransferase [Gammaproteobacteria bacterium]
MFAKAPSSAAELQYSVEPGGVLKGNLRVPGDKSISHRALLLGAIAEGETRIGGFLAGEDCLATLAAIRALGVQVEGSGDGRLKVQGRGLLGLAAPQAPLDLGNSGTAIRILMGLMAGQAFASTLTGDRSLQKRPMQRVIDPLTAMGARIESREGGRAPLTVHGVHPLRPLRYVLPMASGQLKSALLLAGLYAGGYSWVKEPGPSRDHTERMLSAFGHGCLKENGWIGIHGGGALLATQVEVPADLSSAAFFLAAAAVTPGSRVLLENVGVNPTRDGILRLLKRMGAEIRLLNPRQLGAEPVADIEVEGTRLQGIDIGPGEVVLAIDEIPALLIAAAAARGTTRVRGAGELRVKESDRLQAMQDGLATLGVPVESSADGIQVTGVDRFQGGEIQSHGDHRIAMAFAMAALKAKAPILIRDCRNVDTSFPGFVSLAAQAGLGITAREGAAA